jgi:predicted nucleotidyltransferase
VTISPRAAGLAKEAVAQTEAEVVPGPSSALSEKRLNQRMEPLAELAISAVQSHASVIDVEFAGSRSRRTHDELSDWDFAVRTSDFDAIARDLPSLVEPLDPLGAHWEPLGHFPVYALTLSGPTVVEYLFLKHSQSARTPVVPSKDSLLDINAHFWALEQEYGVELSRALEDEVCAGIRRLGYNP